MQPPSLATEDGTPVTPLPATPAQSAYGKIYVDVPRCARCGNAHKGLCFRPLKNPACPVEYFAPCPSVGQPVLLVPDDRPTSRAGCVEPVPLREDGRPDGPHAELRELLALDCAPRDWNSIAQAALDELERLLDSPVPVPAGTGEGADPAKLDPHNTATSPL